MGIDYCVANFISLVVLECSNNSIVQCCNRKARPSSAIFHQIRQIVLIAERIDISVIFVPSKLLKVSKWIVAALFGLVILWKHDAEALWAAMGAVVNAWLSTILKSLLNQDRPSALRSDPGMPSSHAQSIFYAAVFSVASFTRFMGINALTVGFGVITLLCGAYLSWMRVSQRFHTMNQVIVGAAVGSACSLAWFWMWHSFVLQAFILSILVRIFVILSSASFCLAFLFYVIRNWLQNE